MRIVLQLSGITDVVGKMLGSRNKMSNTVATIQALSLLSNPRDLLKIRLKGCRAYAKSDKSPVEKSKSENN